MCRVEIIRYETPSNPLMEAHFYRAATRRAPVVIAIHGGAWRAGAPSRYRHFGPYLAEAGISLISITYAFAGEDAATKHPSQLNDVLAAIACLDQRADELGVDTTRIGLMGDSAGAHLAALAALVPDDNAFEQISIRAVAGFYGVYDMLAQFEHDLVARSNDQITENLLGVSAFDDRRIYFEASPIHHVLRGSRHKPAFLVSWGDADDVVDWRSQSAAFLTALKRTGFNARALPVAGAGHFWIEEPFDQVGSFSGFVAPRLKAFLQTWLL